MDFDCIERLYESMQHGWIVGSLLLVVELGSDQGTMRYGVVDGAHRVTTAKRLVNDKVFEADTAVPCLVFKHCTPPGFLFAAALAANIPAKSVSTDCDKCPALLRDDMLREDDGGDEGDEGDDSEDTIDMQDLLHPSVPIGLMRDLLRLPRMLRMSWRVGMAKARLLDLQGEHMWVEYITPATATDVLSMEQRDCIGKARVGQKDVSGWLDKPLPIGRGGIVCVTLSGLSDCGSWMENAALNKYDLCDLKNGTKLWGNKCIGLLVNAYLCKPDDASHHPMAKQLAVPDDEATFCVVGRFLPCTPVSLGALPRSMTQYAALPPSQMTVYDPRYCAMAGMIETHHSHFIPV